MFQIFYLEGLGQGHRVKHSQLYRLMTNVKVYKINVKSSIFALALTISEISKFQICDYENLGQGHEVQYSH